MSFLCAWLGQEFRLWNNFNVDHEVFHLTNLMPNLNYINAFWTLTTVDNVLALEV